MIEVERSRTGQPYLVVNNHHLSSSVDPVAEARKWVQVYADRASHADVLLVLGLGSGYHVMALAEVYPSKSIHVFEAQTDVISAVLGLHAFPENVRLHAIPPSFDEIDVTLLTSRSVILRYTPSLQMQPPVYRELVLFLTGRHPHYISLYQDIIPSYASLKNLDGPIGVHDFVASSERLSDLSKEDRIWLLLRELVK